MSGASDFRIVGYVFGRTEAPLPDIKAAMLTHVNYAFAFIDNGEVILRSAADSANLATLTALRTMNPDLKILLSVGGWGGSEGFSDAALTDSSRDRFAKSLVRLIEDHDLDGSDIDWEYPGQPGAGNTYRPADRANFTHLLASVREHFAAASNAARPYLLTIASATNEAYFLHTDLGRAHEYLDFINVMSYDFSGAWTDTVWHHTNVRAPFGRGGSRTGMDVAVDRHLEAGVPPGKIVVGAAFYGRGWVDVDGLNMPSSDSTMSLGYHDIQYLQSSRSDFVRVWDDAAQAPYLWSQAERTFITFDDTESIARKAREVHDRSLGGIMFWEYGADTTGTLLQAIYDHRNVVK